MDCTVETSTILTGLATRIATFDPRRISAGGLTTAKTGIADTVGVMLAGQPEPCTQTLLATPGIGDGPGPAAILGTGRRTSLLDATLINGTASHALDFDDFSAVMGGHQSVPLVAPLFALAEDRVISGRELICAYVVGLEVEHRFARAVHPHHYDKGWHPTSTLGIFGTVAAAAYARRLTIEQTAIALAIAASLSSGLKANFGTMTKPLHIGHSARSGLMAVLLAERGISANPGALEHHQGFLTVFNGEGRFDTPPLTEAWDGPLAIELPSLGIKQFPCCGSTHQAIYAAQRLLRDFQIDSEQIARVEIAVHPSRLRHTDTPLPDTELQAKFSVQYAVVRALLSGSVRLADFRDGAFATPPVRRLLAVTEVRATAPAPWDAEVAVTLGDGQRHAASVENMVGRSGAHAMTEAELREKFLDCATLTLSDDRAGRAFAWLMTLEGQSEIAPLIARDLA